MTNFIPVYQGDENTIIMANTEPIKTEEDAVEAVKILSILFPYYKFRIHNVCNSFFPHTTSYYISGQLKNSINPIEKNWKFCPHCGEKLIEGCE